jgi:hypothetical protein
VEKCRSRGTICIFCNKCAYGLKERVNDSGIPVDGSPPRSSSVFRSNEWDRYLLLLCLLQFVITSNSHQVTYTLKPVIENLRKNFSDVFGHFEDSCSGDSGSLEGSTHLPKGITLE